MTDIIVRKFAPDWLILHFAPCLIHEIWDFQLRLIDEICIIFFFSMTNWLILQFFLHPIDKIYNFFSTTICKSSCFSFTKAWWNLCYFFHVSDWQYSWFFFLYDWLNSQSFLWANDKIFYLFPCIRLTKFVIIFREQLKKFAFIFLN